MRTWRSFTAILLVLCGINLRAFNAINVINPQDVPIDQCLHCSFFPDPPNSDPKLDPFSNFAVVEEMNTSYIAVGTKNAVLFVTPKGRFQHKVDVVTRSKTVARCKAENIGKPEMCYSVVDFIIGENTGEIACGKMSGLRNCWKIQGMTSTSIDVGQYYRSKEFAYLDTVPYLYTSFRGDKGYGELLKYNIGDPLRKCQMKFNSGKPTYPTFVSMYEFGDYIYYFFQEYQEHVQSTERLINSRVARLCKYDQGGPPHTAFKNVLTLFSKARLLCEQPAESSSMEEPPIHYNILQRTSHVQSRDGSVYIYGVFRSSDPRVDVSVVCRFSLSKIDDVFETSKYYTPVTKPGEAAVMIAKPRNSSDPRFAQKCTAALDTRKISDLVLAQAVKSAMAQTAVKPDGKQPVFILEKTMISHITSESVDTSAGEDSSHVLHMLGANVLFNGVVPRGLVKGARSVVFSKQIISKEPLDVRDFKYIRGDMYVAAKSKVVIVPDAACDIYATCRQCIHARNPHCGWHVSSKTCLVYNFSKQSEFKQDVENGDFAQFCEPENAKCEVSVSPRQAVPNQAVVLSCKYSGVPATKFIKLTQDSGEVDLTSENFDVKTMDNEVQVVIKKYKLDNAGDYVCHVNNSISGAKCSVTLPGSSPQLYCRVSKPSFWLLTCGATGYPKPVISHKVFDDVTGKLSSQNSSNHTEIGQDKTYLFSVISAFGHDTSKPYKLVSKSFQFSLNQSWHADYADPTSSLYRALKAKLSQAIRSVYPDNMEIDIDNVRFREGSCVASFDVSTVATSPGEIEQPVTRAIKAGRMGALIVFEYTKPTTPDAHVSSTTGVTTTVSPSTPPPATRPGASSKSPPSTTHYEGSTQPGTGDRSGQSGVSAVVVGIVVTILVLIIFILMVILAYMCGAHRYVCKHLGGGSAGKTREEESGEEPDEELQDMKRSDKGRESRAKLLRATDERDTSGNDQKDKKSHSPTIQGSRETKGDSNDASVC